MIQIEQRWRESLSSLTHSLIYLVAKCYFYSCLIKINRYYVKVYVVVYSAV